jgi:taurine dioxygenase
LEKDMTGISVRPLSDDLPFGARIRGVTLANASDADVRAEVNAVFDDRGMIVFEEMDPTNEMQMALSGIFGEPQVYALTDVVESSDRVDTGVVEFEYGEIFEVDGVQLLSWLPWHFDACYTDKLNRGGILRAITIPPEGGLTGFADGIQLYRDIDPVLRDRFENLSIIYHTHLMFLNMRFGLPKSVKPIFLRPLMTEMLAATMDAPRAVHPAIWTRKTGERVLHVAPWQAAGIEGMLNDEGDALFQALIDEINAKVLPYHHKWSPTDMVIWDNWRFIHSVSGNPPQYPREMQRTTISGDYGLGRMEIAGSAAPAGLDL